MIQIDSTDTIQKSNPWKVVSWLWGAFFIAYVTRQSIFSIFPILRELLHFTEVQLELTGTVPLRIRSWEPDRRVFERPRLQED